MSETPATPTAVLLLAEDQAAIAVVVEDALVEGGFTVITVHSGEDAISRFNTHAADVQALVTDIGLGSGPDGWDVARHVREAKPNLAVIYMSGTCAADWSAMGVPNSLMLQKPFAPAQIVSAVASLINQAPPTIS